MPQKTKEEIHKELGVKIVKELIEGPPDEYADSASADNFLSDKELRQKRTVMKLISKQYLEYMNLRAQSQVLETDKTLIRQPVIPELRKKTKASSTKSPMASNKAESKVKKPTNSQSISIDIKTSDKKGRTPVKR